MFTEAISVNRGFGIYMNPNRLDRFKFEIDFSEMKLYKNRNENKYLS